MKLSVNVLCCGLPGEFQPIFAVLASGRIAPPPSKARGRLSSLAHTPIG